MTTMLLDGAINSQDHYHGGSSTLSKVRKDINVIQTNVGYIDDEFIQNALYKNQELISDDNNYLINEYGKFITGMSYIKYSLPYHNFVYLANIIYESNTDNIGTDGNTYFNTSTNSPIDSIKTLSTKDFYSDYINLINNNIEANTFLSNKEKEANINMSSKIKKPFYNDSIYAYSNYLSFYKYFGLIALIAIGICIAPIFSNEYVTKVDQIILSSKYGKNKLIKVKILTAASFTFIYSFILFTLPLLILQILFGFCGYSCPIQLFYIYCTYNITMLEACIILICIGITISLMFCFITCFLSAKLKTSFSVIIIDFILILLPSFVVMSKDNRLLYDLSRILPVKAIEAENIFCPYMFDIGAITIKPFYFYIIFTIVLSSILYLLAYRAFNKHQIVG